MRDLVEIRKFIQQHPGEKLVLCTLVRKSGSSYRGVGSKKVLSINGKSSGLLSGGCLENAIELSAKEKHLLLPYVESFSTLADEDRLLGYQTGCKGVIDVLFEEVDRAKLDLQLPFGVPARAYGVRLDLSHERLGERHFTNEPTFSTDESSIVETWVAPLHLVLVGCGADADAYIPFAKSLGWSLQLMDYRSDLAAPERFPGEVVEHVTVEKMASRIPEGAHVAVVLMTHNYEADLEIVKGLKDHNLGYLGCLGPFTRYERLQKDLATMHGVYLSPQLKSVVCAPIGLFTHSSSPETIALSVVAQIQERLVELKKTNSWVLVLAAGASKRFGDVKALAQWRGQTLIARALATARKFSGVSAMVVTGGHVEKIKPHIQGVHSVFNEHWESGMGTSIAKGVAAIRRMDSNVAYIVVLPVDQPFVEETLLTKLLRESQRSGRCVLTSGPGFMGPPAVIPKKYFERAEALSGDRGLKSVLNDADWTVIEGESATIDLDSPEQLALHP